MRKIFTAFLFFILFVPQAFGQEPKPLKIESNGYPIFGEGYDFGDFSMQYPLGKTEVVVKGFHEKTPFFEVFKNQLLLRIEIVRKLDAVGGLQVEWNFFAEGTEPALLNPGGDQSRQELYMGMEYEPRPGLMINAGYGNLLNSPKYAPQSFKKANAKGSVSLGSKLKF